MTSHLSPPKRRTQINLYPFDTIHASDMSLQTDVIFIRALQESNEIAEYVDDRIYNTAIPMPEEDADNVSAPYIIVAFNGFANSDTTKDSEYDGMTDNVQIGITITAITRPQLAALAIMVRKVIREFFFNLPDNDEEYTLVPLDYILSAQPVQYDEDKPCYWQVLTYQCVTNLD